MTQNHGKRIAVIQNEFGESKNQFLLAKKSDSVRFRAYFYLQKKLE